VTTKIVLFSAQWSTGHIVGQQFKHVT